MRNETTMLRHARGFSIVELLVAVALGGILLAGAVSLFVNNRDTSRITTEFAQMQDSARFAMEMMLRDIRMAGYLGCRSDGDNTDNENVANQVTVAGAEVGALWDASASIEGFDGTIDNTQWYPSGYADNFGALAVVGNDGDNGQILAGTDAFAVRFLQGSYTDTDADGTPDSEASSAVVGGTTTVTANNLAASDYLPVGTIAGVADCGGTDLFIVGADPTGGDTLTVANGGGLSREYVDANRPVVAPFVARRYYVGRNSRGNPALYRTTIRVDGVDSYTELPQELFEGVENMQILYGVDAGDDGTDFDADTDGTPDAYLPAGDQGGAEEDDLDLPNEWGRVVSVKIALMVRSNTAHQGADLTATTYDMLGNVIAPGDNFRRRVFTSTAVLRNQQ